MTDLTSVQDALQTRLATQRVVFWHDPAGQYEADVDAYLARYRAALVATLNDGKRITL